jgi:hypothetical protein
MPLTPFDQMNVLQKFGTVLTNTADPTYLGRYSEQLSAEQMQKAKMEEFARQNQQRAALQQLGQNAQGMNPLALLQQQAAITGDISPLAEYQIQQSDPLRAAQIEAARANAAQSYAAIERAKAEAAAKKNNQQMIESLLSGGMQAGEIKPNSETALFAMQALQNPEKIGDLAANVGKLQETSKGKKEFESVLSELDNLYSTYKDQNAAISTEQPAFLNLVNKISASEGVSLPDILGGGKILPGGQDLGSAFGTENQKVREEIKAKLPLLMSKIKKASGMTGQELNSNVELQFYLNSLGNLSGNVDANQNILRSLSENFGSGDLAKTPPKAPKTGEIKFLGFEESN